MPSVVVSYPLAVSDEPEVTTIAEHLVRRLRECGVDAGFGIVGDYALRLFNRMDREGFPLHITADEQGAAFAADGYARLRGLGVVVVTFSVGALKVANATAGAWAESVPLLVVSGAPGVAERKADRLIHHKIKDFDGQLRVFSELTVAQAVLTDQLTAAAEIDRVLDAMISQQRPGYIEVPRDMVEIPILDIAGSLEITLPKLNPVHLEAALADVLEHLRASRTAVVMSGSMVARRGVADSLLSLAEVSGIPVATSSLAKGLFPERHPLAVGEYMGAVSKPEVVARVESADVILSLGVIQGDLVLGAFTAHLREDRMIACSDTEVSVGPRTYRHVPLWAFLPALVEALGDQQLDLDRSVPDRIFDYEPVAGAELSVETVMALVTAGIDERHGLLLDPGECVFAAVDLAAPAWSLSSAFYATMGYAVPASLGAGLADPTHRPVVLLGDGSFLQSGFEALAAAHHGVHPIVIVLDNGGFGTQRPMLDGPFNDVPFLAAEELVKAFGRGTGVRVDTEDEFAKALRAAVECDDLAIIRACVPLGQASAALTRLTDELAKRV